MKVVAIDRFEYGKNPKPYEPGDEFETETDEHARLLVLAKRVKIIHTQALKAEDNTRRRYNTRRMQAVED